MTLGVKPNSNLPSLWFVCMSMKLVASFWTIHKNCFHHSWTCTKCNILKGKTALFIHRYKKTDTITNLTLCFSSQQFCDVVVRTFDRRGARNIQFDDFIQACVLLKTLTDKFRVKDTQQNGTVRISYEEVCVMTWNFFVCMWAKSDRRMLFDMFYFLPYCKNYLRNKQIFDF